MKKWISRIIDIILGLFIAVTLYAVISMMVTKNENYGVPKAFGHSFLYVASDSMENPEDIDALNKGHGIIIQDVDPSNLLVSTPIYEEESISDYMLDGDVVTFYHTGLSVPDTHRVIGVEKVNDSYVITTMGDNPKIHQQYRLHKNNKETLIRLDIIQEFTASYLIGRMIYHSEFFGNLLSIASPSVAAETGKSAWFFPVMMIVPILIITIIAIIETFIESHKEKVKHEALLKEKMIAQNIDLNDEVAVELFRQKEEIKEDIREQLELEKEKARKRALKELRKEKKNK